MLGEPSMSYSSLLFHWVYVTVVLNWPMKWWWWCLSLYRFYHGKLQFPVYIHTLFSLSGGRNMDWVRILSSIHCCIANWLGMCTNIASGIDRAPNRRSVGENRVSKLSVCGWALVFYRFYYKLGVRWLICGLMWQEWLELTVMGTLCTKLELLVTFPFWSCNCGRLTDGVQCIMWKRWLYNCWSGCCI